MSDEPTTKLWLWQNGDHFLAFDNPCPTYGGGDPMVLGEPMAVAILTPSTPGWAKWDEKGREGKIIDWNTRAVAAIRAAAAQEERERAAKVCKVRAATYRADLAYWSMIPREAELMAAADEAEACARAIREASEP